LKHNIAAVAITYGIVLCLFLAGNVLRTLYRVERRASRFKERQREAEEDAAIATSLEPKPNLEFSKFDVVFVKESPAGVIAIDHRSADGFAVVAIFRNEIARTGHRVALAQTIRAQVSYFLKTASEATAEDSAIFEQIEAANWLGLHGMGRYGHASINAGDADSLVILFIKKGTPFAIESQHGSAVYASITPGMHDVLVTLTSRQPATYLKKFHLIVNTEDMVGDQICRETRCEFCALHGVTMRA
jgi:hypothetical protein